MTGQLRNIVIGGEAGQGIVTVGTLLARALTCSGFNIVVTQGYQSRIRGGHNTFAIRAGDKEVTAPSELVDFLVALNQETISIHKSGLSQNAVVIADVSHAPDTTNTLKVPFKELAPARMFNTAAFGVVCSVLRLDDGIARDVLGASFGKKDPKVLEENCAAFSAAFRWGEGARHPFNFHLKPEMPAVPRLCMNGNDAIALGAMSAGIKFHSFYPMTPSTPIALTLAANAKRLGIVVEQAEDEIAAINMAIGASFAGAPAMVSTAGGGFALMVEGLSLSAMTETPVVIVVGQRPAPATGLPTRTEQGDLEFVLHAGHGEFPRAVFSPASVEDCFHLTRRAFELSEKYQGPVLILTDQFIADSYRAVLPFDLPNLGAVAVGARESDIKTPYRRFAITDDGISPRLLPGLTEHLVVADSDEHTEDGHITEDLAVRKKMVEKRLKKMEGILKETIGPEYDGDENPDILFVTWGSSAGSVREAANILKSRGRKTAMLSFSQVWPLAPGMFMKKIESAREVICVEGNATGQFARLLRRETGFEIKKKILRYDGLPITPEYILREVR